MVTQLQRSGNKPNNKGAVLIFDRTVCVWYFFCSEPTLCFIFCLQCLSVVTVFV